jgi:TonB family protein
MKALLLVLLSIQPLEVSAQKSRGWIKVSPSDEWFHVSLPQQPTMTITKTSYGSFTAEGRVYTTSFGGATYTVWSLKIVSDRSGGMGPGVTTSRDYYAAFVWGSLLKPVRDAVPENRRAAARMSFKSDLYLGGIQGREYSLSLGDKSGTTRFYVDGQRLYVLVVLDAHRNSSATRRFLAGFQAQPTSLPVAATLVADPLLVPPDIRRLPYSDPQLEFPASRSNRIYSASETTRKARIISKPEPSYTKAARDNQVVGTVILSAILTNDGRVENIKVLSGLPYGLTEAAIHAARSLKFLPATKNGYSVSQYAQIEYVFNLY